MTMTDPARLREARATLGRALKYDQPLSLDAMAQVLGLTGGDPGGDVRKMERGAKTITGPITRLIEAYEAGYVPKNLLPPAKGRHSRLRVAVTDEQIAAEIAKRGDARGARIEVARALGISPSVISRRMGAWAKAGPETT